MSYLLAQILVCLIIAGLIGAVIGWLLRGGCSNKLKECEEEWKMKMGSLESEWNSKLQRESKGEKALQAQALAEHEKRVQTQTPSYSYEEELKSQLQQSQVENEVPDPTAILKNATTSAAIAASTTVAALAGKGVHLSEEKIKLYTDNGIDCQNMPHLDESYDIIELEGIDNKSAEALKSMGIHTTSDLVNALKNEHQKIEQVAKSLHIQPETLSSWISMAELVSLPGVDSHTAELIHTVGIASLSELGMTNPNSLHNEMINFNKKSSIVSEVPNEASLSLWTKVAKLLS